MLFVACLAIIAPLTLVVGFRMPAKIGMSISAVLVAISAVVFWQMLPLAIAASIAQAIHRALTIGLILFGGVALLSTMQRTGAMERIKSGFLAISPDTRVQAILVAFAFICLLEGASGFGTPAIVAAPLLIVLGFKPIAAASLALMGDTVACTFGAVGTPLIVGLENIPQYSESLVWLVGAQVTVIDLVIGTLIPLGLVALLLFGFNNDTARRKLFLLSEIAPWALAIGFSYSLSAFFTVRLIGPEFSATIAGGISLIFGIITARRGWLQPAAPLLHSHRAEPKTTSATMPLWKAWLPYGVVIGLLLITRTIPAAKTAVSNLVDLSWQGIFGLDITSSWYVLYSPGTILLLAAIFASIIGGGSLKALLAGIKSSTSTTAHALTALVPTLIMVQIFSNSGINEAELASMPVFIGESLARVFGDIWLGVAPILGAIGAFIAGSATVSTLTIGPVQASVAASTDLPLISVLALHMVGAAAGNIIAIHNVVGVSTVVGLKHQEGAIIRRLIAPLVIYLLLAIITGVICFLITTRF